MNWRKIVGNIVDFINPPTIEHSEWQLLRSAVKMAAFVVTWFLGALMAADNLEGTEWRVVLYIYATMLGVYAYATLRCLDRGE